MRALPAVLAAADPRVVRPIEAAAVYANPAKEFAALAKAGVLLRLAHGYYAIVPEPHRHHDGWTPTIEGVALAIAQRHYGFDEVSLMGMSAARLLGAIPRALGTAVVAVPTQRRRLDTTAGNIVFVKRRVDTLGVRQTTTDLTTGWATDANQTLLDLEDRPELGDAALADVNEARDYLIGLVDLPVLTALARRQRKGAAAERIRTAATR